MHFFFKSKTISVDCFTDQPFVHHLNKINHTRKFFPTWWKSLSKTFDDGRNIHPIPTIKGCEGFNQFFANGISIPLWSDLAIKVDHNRSYTWKFADPLTQVSVHDFRQMNGYLNPNDYGHLKINTPWLITCKEDTQWAWIQNTWAFTNISDIIIPPGVIDYKWNYTTDLNCFVNLQHPKQYVIDCGTPLVNIIPLSNKNIKIHTHLVSADEFQKIKQKHAAITFSGKYKKIKNILQKQEKSICPFVKNNY